MKKKALQSSVATPTTRPSLAARSPSDAFMPFLFFFSSRRRHTRFDCDWSSDVCSSDLRLSSAEARYKELFDTVPVGLFRSTPKGEILDANQAFLEMTRSEERRVGKECRCRGVAFDEKESVAVVRRDADDAALAGRALAERRLHALLVFFFKQKTAYEI